MRRPGYKNTVRLLWILAGIFIVFMAGAAESSYIVKRGDTLYGIARSHGVSLSALAERNGLSKNYRVYTGQRLKIPASSVKTGTIRSLPASVRRAIDRAPVKQGRWKAIVIHHSAVDAGCLKSIDRYHREERHMENGLAYHFLIGNGNRMRDGEIGVSARWTKQLDGGHLASTRLNATSIGICLVGNFERHKPTSKQMEQLTGLVHALLGRCKLPATAVKTHQQAHPGHTRCPGRYFPTSSWLASLREQTRRSVRTATVMEPGPK